LHPTLRVVPGVDVVLLTLILSARSASTRVPLAERLDQSTMQDMKKRALAAVLWSATGWYVGAIVAWALNIGPVLPVVLAASAALIFAGDPRRIIWTGDSDRS
jgi:hypothetical protein